MINVLISTYNGEQYIEEQLDSIFAQTYQNFHIYIRDDGSTDATVRVIKAYMDRCHRQDKISFIAEGNIGFSASFFRLLDWADKGDYWAFCDQDDVWYPEKLEKAVAWMEKNDAHIPLLYHSAFDLGNADLSEKTPYHPHSFNYQFYNSITSNLFFGFAVTINRRLYEMLRQANPEEIKYHDWFAAMITAAFGKYHLSEQVEAIHRQHENNASPLFFFKKIPHGIKLLKGDLFYRRSAKEFKRLFGEQLQEKDQIILGWFVNDRYSLITALRKAFYPHRWNPQIPVELVLRALMLIGKV